MFIAYFGGEGEYHSDTAVFGSRQDITDHGKGK
jgi:hypothetical protein